jgi:hypothetical protein
MRYRGGKQGLNGQILTRTGEPVDDGVHAICDECQLNGPFT